MSDTLKSPPSVVLEMVHDLRTPLTVMRSCADLVAMASEGQPGVLDLLSRLMANLDRVDSMIESALNFELNSELGSPSPELYPLGRMDLNGLALRIVEDFNLVSQGRCRLDAKSQVEGAWDVESLRRAICNLVDNAVKYSDSQTLVTLGIEEAGDYARITVHNFLKSGHVSAIEPTGKGWGLGLSVVRRVMEAHRGGLRVECPAANEIVFILTLPLDPSSLSKA